MHLKQTSSWSALGNRDMDTLCKGDKKWECSHYIQTHGLPYKPVTVIVLLI